MVTIIFPHPHRFLNHGKRCLTLCLDPAINSPYPSCVCSRQRPWTQWALEAVFKIRLHCDTSTVLFYPSRRRSSLLVAVSNVPRDESHQLSREAAVAGRLLNTGDCSWGGKLRINKPCQIQITSAETNQVFVIIGTWWRYKVYPVMLMRGRTREGTIQSIRWKLLPNAGIFTQLRLI